MDGEPVQSCLLDLKDVQGREVVSIEGLASSTHEIEVETIRLSEATFAAAPYQGVTPVSDFTVTRATETRSIPAGSLWIPADQPDFEVAVQLFEPEARDSLLRWGALSSIFEMKTYIGLDRLEETARTMIADDEVRTAWESALEDPDFAADERARYMWWYRRTPFWDDTVGLLPVMRVMSAQNPPHFAPKSSSSASPTPRPTMPSTKCRADFMPSAQRSRGSKNPSNMRARPAAVRRMTCGRPSRH